MKQTIKSLLDLPENWDGLQSPQIKKKSTVNCQKIINILFKNGIDETDIELMPDSDGGITMCVNTINDVF